MYYSLTLLKNYYCNWYEESCYEKNGPLCNWCFDIFIINTLHFYCLNVKDLIQSVRVFKKQVTDIFLRYLVIRICKKYSDAIFTYRHFQATVLKFLRVISCYEYGEVEKPRS